MKRAYIIHGWGGSPKEPMHKWIGKELEKLNFEASILKMPSPENPKIKSWVDCIKENVKISDDKNILIGHSIGCQAILRYFESLNNNHRFWKVIFIAPWMHLDEKTIKEEGEDSIKIAKPWIETPIDFEKVKRHCNNFVCIFSDNDPYVPLSDVELFKKNLNAKTLVLNKRGHFDSSSGVKDLPEILQFLK